MNKPLNSEDQLAPNDRRSFPRLKLPLELNFNSTLDIEPVKTNDISTGGINFSLNKPLNQSEFYNIHINLGSDQSVPSTIKISEIDKVNGKFLHRAFFNQNENLKKLSAFLDSKFHLSEINDRRIPMPSNESHNKSQILNYSPQTKTSKSYYDTVQENLIKSVDTFVKLSSRFSSSPSVLFHKSISYVHNVCANIAICEQAGIPKEKIVKMVSGARSIIGGSVFFKRMQTWPRGYPGDFETIEHIVTQKNLVKKNGIEHVIEEYGLGTTIAQQHRNKVRYQSEMILKTINKTINDNRTPNILIIASGSSPDLQIIEDDIEDKPFNITLLDSDKDALEFSAVNLGKISHKCTFIEGNVFFKFKELGRNGPFDLILSGGLFDYLTDRHISALLKNAYNKLINNNGIISFTNIARGNPYRHWIEYLANWQLIERDEHEIEKIVDELGISNEQLNLKRDLTNLSIFAEITKKEI